MQRMICLDERKSNQLRWVTGCMRHAGHRANMKGHRFFCELGCFLYIYTSKAACRIHSIVALIIKDILQDKENG
jgi:hypothetical protein